MKIYQNQGISEQEKANLPAGTIGVPFTIKNAELIPKSYGDNTVLQMVFKEKGKKFGRSFGYGLIGEEIFNSFMDDMGVTDPKDLVGKTAYGFIAPNRHNAQGIAPSD